MAPDRFRFLFWHPIIAIALGAQVENVRTS